MRIHRVHVPVDSRVHGARSSRTGFAALTLVLWAFALALLALPFLRKPDHLSSEQGDWARQDAKRAFEAASANEGKVFPDTPFPEDVANFEKEFKLGLGAHIEKASQEAFGFESPTLASSGLFQVQRLAPGSAAYAMHCIGCHGSLGDGAGPAARYLAPRPRNFRKGLFKFSSTAAGLRPRRADLMQTLTRGLVGSAMPDFRLLPEETRWNMVEYVRWLGAKGEFEQMMLDSAWEEEALPEPAEALEIVTRRWLPGNLPPIYPGAPEPAYSPESVERGRELFTSVSGANCAACHGERGAGDGPNASDYLDDWGYPIRPRNLQLGVFRAGAESADLYRTVSAGIKGTPMGSFEGAIPPEDIWHLVHFVQSLSREKGSLSK